MRAKSLVLLVVALGCGMIAAVAVSKAVLDKGTAEPAEAVVEIFVAVKDLPHAEKISAENVKLKKWPKSLVPEGAVVDLEQLEGKFTNQTILADEPILTQKIGDTRESFSTGVPSGYRIFDIVSRAAYIKPGDHVDILGTFKVGGRDAVPESRTVMRNVKVHGINGITVRDSEENSQTGGRGKDTVFQLLVKESQLEALTTASSMADGQLQLNLRPFSEDHEDSRDTDNGESFLTWLSESEVEDEPEPNLFAQAMTQFTSAPPEKEGDKKQIVIITPQGATVYEYSDDGKMPRRVVEGEDKEEDVFSEMNANIYSGTSGNVYSGYGGYSPTYPTSTTPGAPASGPGATTDAPPVN